MSTTQNLAVVSTPTDGTGDGAEEDLGAPGRRQVVEEFLAAAGPTGMTWKEFDAASGWNHHGRSTAALSGLHKTGRLVRLQERRERCSVYVLSEYAEGREGVPYGPRATSKVAAAELEALRERNTKLFTALDNLSHARGFANHRHVWTDDAKTCFLCLAREVVVEEATLRAREQASPRPATRVIATGATLSAEHPSPNEGALAS